MVRQLAKNELVRIWKYNNVVREKQEKVKQSMEKPWGCRKLKLSDFQIIGT